MSLSLSSFRRRAAVLAALLASACVEVSDEIDTSAAAISCGGLPAWAAGSYAGGARVAHGGRGFECRPFPASGWCGLGGPYEPGVGWASGDAWIDLGACDGGGSPDAGVAVPDAGSPDAGLVVPDAGAGTVCGGRAPVTQPGAPVADNVVQREVLRYDLALVSGTASAGATAVTVEAGGQARSWPVIGGRWKALVPLATGCNDIVLRTGAASAELALTFQPQTNPRRVRLAYVIASDSDGRFDAPAGEPNDQASAVARVRLAGRLMQTFTAEAMNAQGLGRRTFRLDSDASGLPIVQVFRSSITTAQAHAMTDLELYDQFKDELDTDATPDVKWFAMLGTSHYIPGVGTVGHGARGAGTFCIFGSTSLHTWAQSVDELVARWSDARFIDTSQLSDDSAYRGTHWANYATGLGAAMHEVGHTLSLPHVPASTGPSVMNRGFDHVNRTFVMVEPPSATGSGISPITGADLVGWEASHAVRLRYHRFLSLDDVAYPTSTLPAIYSTGTAARVEAASPLRQVMIEVDGESFETQHWSAGGPLAHEIPLATLRAWHPAATWAWLSAIDRDGNLAINWFYLGQ
jgi:hypothetical protein